MKRWLLTLILPLLLAACTDVFTEAQPYEYLPPATPAGKHCAAQCPLTHTQCKNQCLALKNTCLHKGRAVAHKSYLQYVNDRMAQGLLVDKKESDFYQEARNCPELANCEANCDISRRSCHSNCGGAIKHNGNCIIGCTGNDQITFDDLWGGDASQ
ncbi:MAG: hypothetical protein K2Q01_09560 [Rickettsiales bacterium]|nr:hypothetical protein [Rickettsiales bacterium]